MSKTKVKIEVECFLEDVHDLDTTGFKYMEPYEDEEQELNIAGIKMASFIMDKGQFKFVHVKKVEKI